jgi:hypothetical protein
MITLVWHLREAGLQLRQDIYNGIIRLSESGVYLQYPPSVASEPDVYHKKERRSRVTPASGDAHHRDPVMGVTVSHAAVH